MPFGHEIQRVAQVETANRSPRALNLAIVTWSEGDDRPVELFLETRSQDSYHALMPFWIKQAEAVRIQWVGRRRGFIPGKKAADHRDSGFPHVCFDFPPLAVECVKLTSDLRGSRRIISDQTFDSEGHIIKPPGRIQARTKYESEIMG